MSVGAIANLITSGMSMSPSVFSRFVCAATAYSWLNNILNFLYGLFYTVAKYMLYFVDLIFSYIQKLCGLDMSVESLDKMFSNDSDILFNLLNSGRDLVTTIIRNLLVLAIVVIVIMSIIAIIKGQFDVLRKGQDSNALDVIKTMFKAFIMMLLTPLIALGGVIFSDLVLQTLYNATNTSGTISLGTQLFTTAATSANAYRLYAQGDKRIPITFNTQKSNEVTEYYINNSVSEGFVKYLQDSKTRGKEYNPIYATYMTFLTGEFTTFSSMNDIVEGAFSKDQKTKTKKLYETYYDYYLIEDEDDPNGYFPSLRRIESYAEQYQVMADVIDFCVQTGTTVYIKTIEQVLDSICLIRDEAARNRIFKSLVEQYKISFYNGYDEDYDTPNSPITVEGTDDYKSRVKNKRTIISYTSDYISIDENEEEQKMQIRSDHVVGTTDELLGAKFIIAVEANANLSNGTQQTYFTPLLNGYEGSTADFQSSYILNGNIITAKGLFASSDFPTAIKILPGNDADGNQVNTVVFYREDIGSQAVGQLGDYFSLSVDTSGGFFNKIFKMIKSLFNPSELIPKMTVNLDAMVLNYDKAEGATEVDTLVDGRMRLGYFMQFNPTYPTNDAVLNMGSSFTSLYAAPKLNFLLLLSGSIILLRIAFSAFSSLIERSFELFLLFITYPAACATIPLDNGGAYTSWVKGWFERMFRTYGLILGINFVLMLFPVINQIEFFTQPEVGSSKIVRRAGSLFFNFMTVREITNMLNVLTAFLFELVAFTLLETVPDMISAIVAGPESALKIKDNNVFTKVKDTTVKMVSAVGKVVMPPLHMFLYVFSSKDKKKAMRKQLKSNILSKVGLESLANPQNFIPFSGIAQDITQRQQQRKTAKEQKEAADDLMKAADDPNATKEDMKRAYAQYMAKSVGAKDNASQFECPSCKQKYNRATLDNINRVRMGNKGKAVADMDEDAIGVKSDFVIKKGNGFLCPNCRTPLQVVGDKGKTPQPTPTPNP